MYDSKKSKFIKEPEASELWSSLGIKTLLSKTPSLGSLLFWRCWQFNTRHKMNEIVNKLLLAWDKFMPKIHLKKPGFTYSACESSTKSKQKI